jgi:protein-tyrosine-phosphatase
MNAELARRALVHSALADPHRLALVDELAMSDRSPSELGARLGIASNLLAHHLGILLRAGLVERSPSAGDGRRRYVRLVPDGLAAIAGPVASLVARNVLFVCAANSARSQLAAAAWNARHEVPASSAGTRPAASVHREAIHAAARAGLDIGAARTRSVEDLGETPDLVITVCDVAHEELRPLAGAQLLHWSTPDPARIGTPDAFDDALRRVTRRVETVAPHVRPPHRPRRSRA